MIRGVSAQLEVLRERIASWHAQLPARDRRALLIGAVAVTVLPLLALGWQVTERNNAAQTRIAEKRRVLRQWISQQPQWQARGFAAIPMDLSLQQRIEAARNAAGIVAGAIGVTEQTYYRWKKKFGGLRIDQAKRLKDLEKENARLKRLLADAELDKAILREAASGNF